MLVQVFQVTVASLVPAENEFVVDAGLRVDDLFYLADPFPWEGRPYANIVGPLAIRGRCGEGGTAQFRRSREFIGPAGQCHLAELSAVGTHMHR
ncbi:MAG: hypothetical protein QM755_02055 [Luteolibacter sp.]